MAELDTSVAVWWAVMCVIGVVNIALWSRMARRLTRGDLFRHERLQLIFGGIYVLGTASRCFVLRSIVVPCAGCRACCGRPLPVRG